MWEVPGALGREFPACDLHVPPAWPSIVMRT